MSKPYKNDPDTLVSLIVRCCAPAAVSGQEYAGLGALRAIMEPFCDEICETLMGSLLGFVRCGIPDAPLVLFDAHLDQIGAYVSGYEKGFLKLQSELDPRTLPGSEVYVYADKIYPGIVANAALADAKKTETLGESVIDLGYDEAFVKAHIPIATPVGFPHRVDYLADGHISCPSLDDRCALAAVLEAVQRAKELPLACDIAVLASSREECGGDGALTGAAQTRPQYAIAVDVSFSNQEGAPTKSTVADDCGCTIVRGPHLNRALTNRLFRLAAEYEIPHGIEVEPADTGTNASMIRSAGEGVACGLIGIPIRYMHTQVETVRTANVEAAAALLCAFAQSIQGGEAL